MPEHFNNNWGLRIYLKMSLYLKRNGTLYRNLLDKEIVTGRSLLEKDLRELYVKVLSNKVGTCIKRLYEWVDKLDGTDEIISQEKPDELKQTSF